MRYPPPHAQVYRQAVSRRVADPEEVHFGVEMDFQTLCDAMLELASRRIDAAPGSVVGGTGPAEHAHGSGDDGAERAEELVRSLRDLLCRLGHGLGGEDASPSAAAAAPPSAETDVPSTPPSKRGRASSALRLHTSLAPLELPADPAMAPSSPSIVRTPAPRP